MWGLRLITEGQDGLPFLVIMRTLPSESMMLLQLNFIDRLIGATFGHVTITETVAQRKHDNNDKYDTDDTTTHTTGINRYNNSSVGVKIGQTLMCSGELAKPSNQQNPPFNIS